MGGLADDVRFHDTIRQVHGAAGERWLERLPAIVAGCVRRWELTLEPPFALSYSWVAPARRAGGKEAVLKLGVPGDPELRAEAEVLALLGGDGAVALLAEDAGEGSLLLERLRPGTPLAALVDEGRDDGELDLDRERLRAWAFAQAVLSAVWSAEDHGEGWEEAMAWAEVLETA